jgi:hypothetical protein
MSVYRHLKEDDAALLKKLLNPRFPGRDELVGQMLYLTAGEIDEDGASLSSAHRAAPLLRLNAEYRQKGSVQISTVLSFMSCSMWLMGI